MPAGSHYDADSRSYDALYGDEQLGKLKAVLASGWRPGSRIIDIGCGSALLTGELSRNCDIAVGLDISPSMLHAGRRRRVELVLGDAAHPPFRIGAFDTCVCFTAFHHFMRKRATIEAMAGLVASGGSVALSLLHTERTSGDVRTVRGSRSLRLSESFVVGRDFVLLMKRV
jgi:ubiquinone/menaquinone biosynthesis C-methylase UbiE